MEIARTSAYKTTGGKGWEANLEKKKSGVDLNLSWSALLTD